MFMEKLQAFELRSSIFVANQDEREIRDFDIGEELRSISDFLERKNYRET